MGEGALDRVVEDGLGPGVPDRGSILCHQVLDFFHDLPEGVEASHENFLYQTCAIQ